MTVRRWFATLLDVGDESNRLAGRLDAAMLVLIAANVAALILETVESIYIAAPAFFDWFETISLVVFAAEYALRLWTCVEQQQYQRPFWGRLRFVFTPMAIVDLLAIAPPLLPFISADLRSIRIIRLFRLLRVAKLVRYSHALRTFGRVLRSRQEQLVTMLMFLGVLLIVASTLMYFVERDVQPEVFSSIPATMWWAIATLTTVGYGDVYPVTMVGRILGSVIAILGIGLFALPTGILGAAFVEELHGDRARNPCPHCGAVPEPNDAESAKPGFKHPAPIGGRTPRQLGLGTGVDDEPRANKHRPR